MLRRQRDTPATTMAGGASARAGGDGGTTLATALRPSMQQARRSGSLAGWPGSLLAPASVQIAEVPVAADMGQRPAVQPGEQHIDEDDERQAARHRAAVGTAEEGEQGAPRTSVRL